ncbi:hypothetical protein WJX82_009545 [Trebouxia sp. C0006]
MEPRCSRCGEQAVECDGQSVCQGCGFVISEGSFVAETGAEGQQLGQHVNANGRVSGGSGRNGYHLGLVNRILPQQFPVKAYGEMTVLVNRVGCSNQIKQDALHYMESVYPALGGQGRMSLERMAAACLYLAVRLCKANVLESYDKLQEWSYFSENLTVGDSSASKAAMLYLSAKAHQVKVTARTVAPIFDGVKEKTLSDNARKIKIALAKGAQALPWLEDKSELIGAA